MQYGALWCHFSAVLILYRLVLICLGSASNRAVCSALPCVQHTPSNRETRSSFGYHRDEGELSETGETTFVIPRGKTCDSLTNNAGELDPPWPLQSGGNWVHSKWKCACVCLQGLHFPLCTDHVWNECLLIAGQLCSFDQIRKRFGHFLGMLDYKAVQWVTS